MPARPYLPRVPDVAPISNDLSQSTGLPLVTIMRNEMQILPDFLSHYRMLGVQRFFILDDCSDDGTREFLSTQPDVSVLVSTHRYGDRPTPDSLPPELQTKPDTRMIHVWRTGLMNRFCANQWGLQCDADEFLLLPDGVDLPKVIAMAEKAGAQGIWGGMIDLYPANISDLAAYPKSGFTHPQAKWYFDGIRHFSLQTGAPPKHRYEGVRHRLDVAYADKPDISAIKRLKLRLLGRRKAPSGTLVKPILQHWQPGAYYLNSHRTTLPLSDQMLLPLLHYRYTPAMLGKLEWAVDQGGYSKGNADYARVEGMLGEMQRQKASFLGKYSTHLTGFEDLRRTGNAIL